MLADTNSPQIFKFASETLVGTGKVHGQASPGINLPDRHVKQTGLHSSYLTQSR